MDTDARILIVDDTKANLDVLDELLNGEGYTVSLAPNGDIALRIASQAVPDLILLDVMMPGLNGFEVCERLRSDPKTADVPVIFITAEDDPGSVLRGFEVGGLDYIRKPFNDTEVLARVQTHMKIDRLTRELSAANDELRRANATIQEVSDRKSQFVANLSHELRTPINAILGFNGLVLQKSGESIPEQQRQNLGKAMHAADNMLEMINDLLDLSKIEAGKVEVRPETFQVGTLVASCCDEIATMISDAVELRFDPAEVTDIDTDRMKLRQIMLNLLSNAAKFTESGSVDVSVGVDDGELTIVVTDTGIGIPEEALESIFDEFEQAPNSTGSKGTGLGLPITRGMAGLLGGAIDVSSTVGVGSTFTVRIPAVYAPNAIENDDNETVLAS